MFVDIQAKLHGRVETQLQVADMQRVDKKNFSKWEVHPALNGTST